MLGTSIGVVSESTNGLKEYTSITKTTFGTTENQTTNPNTQHTFYTGKPHIENLGYSFLLRNYRSDLGKWQTSDPIGYPDGWNNFAYCGNGITFRIDLYGASWGNSDFVSHYWNGGGEYVSLDTMGLKNAVYNEINSNAKSKLSSKVDGEIINLVKSDSNSSGTSNIRKDFTVGHGFGNIVWAMGGGNVTARTNVIYSWSEGLEGDSIYRYYSWVTYDTSIIYADTFAQPFDLDNDGSPNIEVGAPYDYGAVWHNQSIPDKSGKIYIGKNEEVEE